MTAVRAAVSKNLYRAHDLAARQLEDRVAVLEIEIANNQLSAQKANGSIFAPPGCIAAEYLIEDLRHEKTLLRKRIISHREKMTTISRSVCPVCQQSQSKHCSTCGSCNRQVGGFGGLTCEVLRCETEGAKSGERVPAAV